MGLFNRKKNRKTADGKPIFDIMGGLLGDKEKRTYEGGRYLLITLALVLLLASSIGYFMVGKSKYNYWSLNNTTAPGTTLAYSRSLAPVTIASVWTDKNRDVTVVEFKYDDTAKNLLSTKGKNYNLYLATDKKDPNPKVEKMEYGLLGTEGNGYLFIKGKLKPRAYQIYIANTLEFTSETSDVSTSTTVSDIDESVTKKISEVSLSDISDNGIAEDKEKKADEPVADNINFRINNYSVNTKVFKGSFLDANGDIDYSAILKNTNIKTLIDFTNKQIEKSEHQLTILDVGLKEYQDRLRQNPEDLQAKENIETTKTSIEEEKKVLRELEQTKAKYVTADFDKSSFGEMQEKFKVVRIDQ